jgi:hypothetical protein
MARVPLLTKRRERKQLELAATIGDAVEKAFSPAVAMAATMSSGATYPVPQANPSSPFQQMGPGGGYQPLPRPPSVFDSAFGPAAPLWPDALDNLNADGRTPPRRYQYQVAENINLYSRDVPFTVLSRLASGCDVVSRCIELIQDSLVGLDWSWGFSQQILQQIMQENNVVNTAKANAIAREKFGDELNRVQQFWLSPDKRSQQNMSAWLTQFIWSTLTYDGVAVAPEFNLGGELLSLMQIDTPSIKILLDAQGFPPRPPAPAYQQILYGFSRSEFQAEDMEQGAKTPQEFERDQMAYFIRRPRPHTVYGFSPVEECINVATIYQARQAWLHAEYSHGVLPQIIIEMAETDSWTPEQVGYYSQILNDQMSGQIQRRQQAMVLRPGMTAHQMAQLEHTYQGQYDDMLVLQIGAKFGVPQALLGIQMHSSIGGGAAGKQQSDQSESFATDALRNHIINCINDLSRRFLGVGPELTMTATGGGNDSADLTRAQADEIDVNSGIRARNEIRAERGLPLDPTPEADALGITIATGVSFLTGGLDAQAAAAAIAATPPPAPVHIHQAAPGATDGTQESDGDANTGQQSGNGGTGSNQGSSASVAGPRPTSGSVSAQSSGDSKTTSSGAVAAKDDERQPDTDAEKSERIAFAKFVKARAKSGTWRAFEFTHVNADEASELNEQGRLESLKKVEAPSGPTILKAASDWAKHPNHELHDIVVAHFAPKLAAALTPSKSQITAAIAAAKNKVASDTKKAAGASEPSPIQVAAQDAIAANVKMAPDEAANILRMIYGNAYLAGAHTAVGQIGGGATLSAGLEEADAAADWSGWVPGWSAAGDLTADGGLADLLDNAGQTISSVAENMISRLGNVLADGISAGSSTDQIASDIADSVGGNADLIANTETARAMSLATQDTYSDNDVSQFDWLAEDSACELCLENTADGPYDVGGDPTIPEHPRCRCAYTPVINIPGQSDTTDTSSEDDS